MAKIDEAHLHKLNEIKQAGIEPYPYTFSPTHHAADIQRKYEHLKAEEHTKDVVVVAGRIVLRRPMGKAAFAHLQDQSGRVQLYFREDELGEKTYDLLVKKTDLGDIMGVSGIVFKTKTGETTIEVMDGQLLSKSLLTMPEKYHGLKDIELKYRQRYVDLFINPEVKDVFTKRSKMLKVIRDFFNEKGFLEMETPTLQTIYGGARAKPFVTHINTWKMKMYLSISPELYLKRLLVGGFEKVFTICKNFRNEDVDTSHNPEFTMLEVYQAYVDYTQMMEYMEQIYEKACIALNGKTTVKHNYKGEEITIDFKAPWKRMTMMEALKHYADIEVSAMTEKHIRNLVEINALKYEGELTWGKGVQLLFEELVEDKLIQPIHITDHPLETTPLCKKHRTDDRLIERFESFCLGMELCNAYSELNDPILQRTLLEEQSEELGKGDEEAHPLDEDFLTAMEYGMPPAGGLGFGVDRMAIFLTGVGSIRDVILFPTMKPIEEEKK